MVRIEDIIVKSFLSVVGPIASACNMFHASRSQCFELYGFDIIVDENFRPWLLEIKPELCTSNIPKHCWKYIGPFKLCCVVYVALFSRKGVLNCQWTRVKRITIYPLQLAMQS
ncbi:hypothetical protein AHF37_11168 [Paragonimus kellicotti]|nr:hypothetical protein AHF37_11168 [Paragonimus kellicotti]